MGKQIKIKTSYPQEPRLWHFEDKNGYASCQERAFDHWTAPAGNSTLNPAYVTCEKCLAIMAEQGITPEKDGWRNAE